MPVPAVLKLLAAAKTPISGQEFPYECLTPTAAAILTTVAGAWGKAPAMQSIGDTGYGAGDLDPRDYPNVCRVTICQGATEEQRSEMKHSSRFSRESLVVIEAILDDFLPQALAYTSEQLLKAGAMDVYVVPVIAKKGRSGHLLTVLCHSDKLSIIEELIFEQTSTIGLRTYLTDRLLLERDWVTVSMSEGKQTNGKVDQIRIKVCKDLDGNIINVLPEYDDCVLYAQSAKLPLKEVFNMSMDKFNRKTE